MQFLISNVLHNPLVIFDQRQPNHNVIVVSVQDSKPTPVQVAFSITHRGDIYIRGLRMRLCISALAKTPILTLIWSAT